MTSARTSSHLPHNISAEMVKLDECLSYNSTSLHQWFITSNKYPNLSKPFHHTLHPNLKINNIIASLKLATLFMELVFMEKPTSRQTPPHKLLQEFPPRACLHITLLTHFFPQRLAGFQHYHNLFLVQKKTKAEILMGP